MNIIVDMFPFKDRMKEITPALISALEKFHQLTSAMEYVPKMLFASTGNHEHNIAS